MSLIDVHAHFVTDDYRDAAVTAGHAHADGMPGWPDWQPETHLRLMDSWGVETSMLSMSSPGVHFGDDAQAQKLARSVNTFGAGIAGRYPGRFGHFASLPLPDVDGSIAEAVYALDELGSDGVAVETNAYGTYLGSERFEPLWKELDDRQALVFVHPTSPACFEATALGRPRPMIEFLFDSARAVSDLVLAGVLLRYPDVQWIFTHSAGVLPLLADRMNLFQSLSIVGSPTDPTVSEQISGLWFDIAGTPFPNAAPALVKAFGSERLLFGTDYCWTPELITTNHVASLDEAVQPEGDSWRALTTRNAKRLLPRLSTVAR